MSPLGPRALAFVPAVAALALASPALAQDAPAPSSSPTAEDLSEETPAKPRPPAPDTRFAHVFVQPRVGYSFPGGNLATTVSINDLAAPGPFVGGVLGFGLGRSAVLEVSGSYAFLGAPGTCTICAGGKSFEMGLGFRYHLAQGFALDPWISYGVAFRSSTFNIASHPGANNIDTEDVTFRGIDLARFAMGGDFYPIPKLGFGPFVGFDLGTATVRPRLPTEAQGDPNDLAPYVFVELGLQVSFDPLKRALREATRSAKAW